MLIPLALGAAALYGLYRYDQKRKTAGQAATVPNPPPGAGVAATDGGIAYTATSKIQGSGNDIRHVVPPPPLAPVAYAPATTVTDPNVMHQTVAAYQAAQPTPSGVFYYPADGDVWGILLARLGGTPKARIENPGDKSTPLSLVAMADLGKLNGFVSAKDFDNWIKAKKPLQLPLNGYNDVSGPTSGAMGSIR